HGCLSCLTNNIKQRDLRQWHYCLCHFFHNALLQSEQFLPPRRKEPVESCSTGRANGEQGERIGRFDGRNVVLSEQIHLCENHAMRATSQLFRMRRNLVAKLVVLRLPVH